jgi:hypothetical protein
MSGGGVSYKTPMKTGHLHAIDQLSADELDKIGAAIKNYADTVNSNKQSLHWQRSVRWVENIFFSAGRHYIDDILVSRLTNSSDSSVGDLSTIQATTNSIPLGSPSTTSRPFSAPRST